MNPRLRNFLGVGAACIAAVFLGSEVAQGAYTWPALAALVIVATILVRLTRLPADTIFAGLLVVGYIVGNRGFAQLMPVARLPLFPAEYVLLLAFSWRLVVASFERTLPCRRDWLNFAVFAWLVAGTIRVAFDVPRHGLLAARDYAMIYYAVFFFLVQHMAREEGGRAYFRACFLAASVLLVPGYLLFLFFAPYFLTRLTVQGVPLIYYKGDLVTTFLGIGSLLVFHWARGRQRFWAWPLSAAMFVLVAVGDNRSSLLAVAVAGGLLLLARRWQYAVLQTCVGAIGLAALLALSTLFGNSWAEKKIDGLTDRMVSLADVTGSGRYESQESFNKGDNNRFRLVWWRNVVEETWATNPVFGLGFGADLARGFVQEYYPEAGEEFNTRSPHNIFVTAFGRMGAIGVLTWLLFCVVLVVRAWRAMRHTGDPVLWSLWSGALAIVVASTFGVVLEGPMGAVIFWTLLGLASSWPEATPEPAGRAAGEMATATAVSSPS